MNHTKTSTILLIALLFLSTEVAAQKIYKCGTTYSQQACPDGVIIPAASTPEAAQKTATDQATRRDTLSADRMEQLRLQQEAKDLAANTPNAKRKTRTTATKSEAKPSRKKSKVKYKEDEFRAVVPETTTTRKHSKK